MDLTKYHGGNVWQVPGRGDMMICLVDANPCTFILVSDPRICGSLACDFEIDGQWKHLFTEAELIRVLTDAKHVGKMHELVRNYDHRTLACTHPLQKGGWRLYCKECVNEVPVIPADQIVRTPAGTTAKE
jgi:hypothetical protein